MLGLDLGCLGATPGLEDLLHCTKGQSKLTDCQFGRTGSSRRGDQRWWSVKGWTLKLWAPSGQTSKDVAWESFL